MSLENKTVVVSFNKRKIYFSLIIQVNVFVNVFLRVLFYANYEPQPIVQTNNEHVQTNVIKMDIND